MATKIIFDATTFRNVRKGVFGYGLAKRGKMPVRPYSVADNDWVANQNEHGSVPSDAELDALAGESWALEMMGA